MFYELETVSVIGVLCVIIGSRGVIRVLLRLFMGFEVSQRKFPPHSGQKRAGTPSGSTGGNASITISSIQSVWSQERQR